MRLIGNILWLICGGFIAGLAWLFIGLLWCITIIGIPIGIQCFKIAELSFSPFGKEIVYRDSATSILLNIIWIIVSGIPLAVVHVTSGIALCLTIIGIPFGIQSFKLAILSLMPFGANIVRR